MSTASDPTARAAAAPAGPAPLPEETLAFFGGDELRARVFIDKYALRDAEGRVLERTPVEMWRRVARGVASVEPTPAARERFAREFYWLLEDFRFIPGGRIMHAVGNHKRVTALNCFPAGTRVVTRTGLRPIEEVAAGEEVLTHRNRFRRVTHTMSREVEEPLRTLRLWSLGDRGIACTKAHRFLAFDGARVGWVEAQHLTPDHYVKLGRVDETPLTVALDLLDHPVPDAIEMEAGPGGGGGAALPPAGGREPAGVGDGALPAATAAAARQAGPATAVRERQVVRDGHYCVLEGDLFVQVRACGWTDARVRRVYDLCVEEDHSFVAEFAVCHNCYVIPIKDDSIEAIFQWMKEAARTYSLGGGVGGDITVLRPAGAPVNNAARTSTGSISFMELMSLTTGTIGQSGRRGALMITIADHHPDVLEFTRIKRNLNRVRYANISVRISDAFMRAVEADGMWELYFENDRAHVHRTVRAREIWDELVRGARDYAEPGVIFWDTVKRWSTSEYNGMEVTTTNPCSEIPLEPYGACCLGNLSLAEFVKDEFTPQAQVDWARLDQGLRLATRFLDDVLDYNADKHPLPEQRAASLYSRRIGVGFTGLGDMLCKLRLKYDTDEAVAFVDRFFERAKNIVYDESVALAREKGVFPGYDREAHLRGRFLQTLDPQVLARIREHGLRNVALLTVPPVGSGASLAGTTSGIEPIFDLGYTRRSESLSQETFTVYHPLVRTYMERFGLRSETELPPYFVTAHEIQPEMRVRMQAAIQKHIDHSISSTVNCPADTSAERVAEIYVHAWKMGCKGITVYRADSRENILTAQSKRSTEAAGAAAAAGTALAPLPAAARAAAAPAARDAAKAAPRPAEVRSKRPRPKVTTGRTERIETPRGRIYVTINEDGAGVCEVFVQSLDVEADGIGRIASLALRTGADPRDVIEQLWRVQSREVAIDRSADGTVVRVTTVAQGVALALGRALYGPGFRPDLVFPMADRLPAPRPRNGDHDPAGDASGEPQPQPERPAEPAVLPAEGLQQPLLTFAGVCPDCGSSLIYENGCSSCRSCGYSRC
jgi:ribonucleoside-diphosphate reductase alpha chain